MEESRKNVRFQRKTGYRAISEMVRDTVKDIINH